MSILKYLLAFPPLVLLCFSCKESEQRPRLGSKEVIEDINYLDRRIMELSAYQGLNGFAYRDAFQEYIKSLGTDSIDIVDFGVFLSDVIGRFGDRHAYARDYAMSTEKYLPFTAAPFQGKMIGLTYQDSLREFQLFQPQYPYLKEINGEAIGDYIKEILPEERHAPPKAYQYRAARELAFIEYNYLLKDRELPDPSEFIFSDGEKDTSLILPLRSEIVKGFRWEDKYSAFAISEDDMDDSLKAVRCFEIDQNKIAYIRIPEMARFGGAKTYFQILNEFLNSIRNSKALIVDIRSNPGGRRDLIVEIAKYVVHPDSIYIVNLARQRGLPPFDEDMLDNHDDRYLYPLENWEPRVKKAISSFMATYGPMYELPEDKFSPWLYTVLDGKALSEGGYHYDKPVYLLADESSFSAASVFAATFKGLPNVTLVGITTDGSSGNTESFRLPHSDIKIKLSTMASFQKDGRLLDGYGTEPDIAIDRSLDQLLWKEDYQLKKLKEIILENN